MKKKQKKSLGGWEIFSPSFSIVLFFCSRAMAKPGRQEDGIWKAFEKKKEDGKTYSLAVCKGCKEKLAGV